ncbi:MAG: methylated-DNA--[protein]-cysteine S-methyltransferase [Defluviitaleaceae bacterium]|nr:methylated-DNA--[protein]-cysteine S-methyltransferase [Defluviitaleaceae bacterium]
MNIFFYNFPIGQVGIGEKGGAICRVYFGKDNAPAEFIPKKTPLISTAALQIREYFEGKRTTFELPFSYEGTEFQRKVWDELMKIPIGETRSYREIAEAVGNPKAFRAVGMANHRNPLALFIPCHRVINNDGGLGGYAGGLNAKKYLLELESRYLGFANWTAQ